MFITASLSCRKIRNGKKVLRKMNSLVLSHSLIKLLRLEKPMTCKISRLLLKDKNMKANSVGIKWFHRSDSGYLSGYRRAAELAKLETGHVD